MHVLEHRRARRRRRAHLQRRSDARLLHPRVRRVRVAHHPLVRAHPVGLRRARPRRAVGQLLPPRDPPVVALPRRPVAELVARLGRRVRRRRPHRDPRRQPAAVPLDERVVARGRVVARHVSVRVVGERRRPSAQHRRRQPRRRGRPRAVGVRRRVRVPRRVAGLRREIAQRVVAVGQRPARRPRAVQVRLRAGQPAEQVVGEVLPVRALRPPPEQPVAAPGVRLVLERRRPLRGVDPRHPARRRVERPRRRHPVAVRLPRRVAPGVHSGVRHQRRRTALQVRQVAARVVFVRHRKSRRMHRPTRPPVVVVAVRAGERLRARRRRPDRRRHRRRPRCGVVVNLRSGAFGTPALSTAFPTPRRHNGVDVRTRSPRHWAVGTRLHASEITVRSLVGRQLRVSATTRVAVRRRRSQVGGAFGTPALSAAFPPPRRHNRVDVPIWPNGHALQQAAAVVDIRGHRPVVRHAPRRHEQGWMSPFGCRTPIACVGIASVSEVAVTSLVGRQSRVSDRSPH